MSYQASKDANGKWVASPGSLLTVAQVDENEIMDMIARGQPLEGPYAASAAGRSQAAAQKSAQDDRIKKLEAQVAALLAASGATEANGQLKGTS